jgi:hypothetical protein
VAVITYTATRSIMGGHTQGLVYKIETQFYARPRHSSAERHTRVSLAGIQESYLYRIARSYAIKSDLIALSALNNWREFFDSVANSETFQIDFTGTIAVPGTDVDVRMTSTDIVESEIGGALKQYQFAVEEV